MHIAKIELENIKSHAASTYEFTRGTTAITGENGAGKTTIIEAIAWVLFDLLEYKKEDFVRRGEKKGSVRITLESGLDEREYVIYRDTAAGYHVTDPRLDTRIADKKDEVFRFLWQHLGLEPGTDLKSLFRQAIGVPQGTFTAIFLEGSTERKVAFDRLLKVEEYRQAAEKLRETSRYLDVAIVGIREKVARAEGELTRSDIVEKEHQNFKQQTEKLALEVATLEKQIAESRGLVTKLDEAERIERAVTSIKAEQKRVQESLETVQRANSEIASLRPKVVEQDKLEQETVVLREKIADAKAIDNQIKSLDLRIERLRNSYRSNLEQIREAEEKAKGEGEITVLEKSETEIVRQIAELRAGLERDLKFQSEIKDGLCPILSEKCLNLKPGQTLDAFVTSKFSDIKFQISNFESQKQDISISLKKARDAERFASVLVNLRKNAEELTIEGKHLSGERNALETRVAGLAEFEKQLADIGIGLRALGDPRSRIRFLENETAREIDLRDSITKVESNLERLESDRRQLIESLDEHRELIEKGYDAKLHAAERSSLHEAEKRHAETRARLDAAEHRENQLAAELKHFADLRNLLTGEFKEKERFEKIAEATAFIRDTLKEAAPRVARNYVYHVSLEANLMFREITGNAEQTLKWGEDYAILLEEDGYERPFQSLSGGEQMAAALSIRLALLKQLTDIRIAFFDEPTTNLDAERRENLALQLSRITNFDQLFVISHDDTFDNFVDSHIFIEPEGQS